MPFVPKTLPLRQHKDRVLNQLQSDIRTLVSDLAVQLNSHSGSVADQVVSLQAATGSLNVVTGSLLTGSVYASFNTATGQTMVNGSATVVNFDTSEIDTHGAVTTGANWRFTVPDGKAGLYELSANVSYNPVTNSTPTVFLSLFKNGTELKRFSRMSGLASTAQYYVDGTITVPLSASDYVDFRLFQNSGINQNLETTRVANWVTILQLHGLDT